MAYAEHHGVTFLPVLVFLLLSCSPDHLVRAQTGDQQFSNSSYARFSPTVAIIVVIMIATFFFLAFFSIYISHCSGASSGSAAGGVLSLRSRRAAAAGAPRGLDPSVIKTFPTFTYSEVKEHKLGKGALECAVCLNEFEEDETLRFIPRCDHVFHPECIDAWLLSHVTCPVCRADLVPAQPAAGDNHDEPVVVQVPESTHGDTTHLEPSNSRINDEIVIQVDDVNTNQPQLVIRTPRNQNPPRSWSIRRLRSFGFGKLRLDSIGHGNDNNNTMVVVQPGENLERFTLRLPEQVRKEMMLRRSKSYIGTSSLARSGSSGAGGSRSPRRMNDRRSDRWAFLTRALSMPTTSWSSTKVVADHTGEGGSNNSRVIRGPVKLPSFKCLEPKAVNIDQTDAAALFPAGDPPGVGGPSQ